MIDLRHGDCREVMATLPEASVDAIVTDPPYGLEFMGKDWDKLGVGAAWERGSGFSKPGIGERETAWVSYSATSRFGAANPTCATCGGRARGAKRCMCDEPEWKPIGKRRKHHDAPAGLTGSGAHKHGHAMQDWHESWAREAIRVLKPGGHLLAFGGTRTFHRLTVALEDAGFEIRDCLSWLYGSGFPKSHNIGNGFGTALKPAWEPVIVARKPLSGTVARNVAQHGTGALNIDGCRLAYLSDGDRASATPQGRATAKSGALAGRTENANARSEFDRGELKGRWPANVCLDEDAAALLDAMSGVSRSTAQVRHNGAFKSVAKGAETARDSYGYSDTGGASRFFYVAKASRAERNAGLEGMPEYRNVANVSVRTRMCNVCGTKAKAPGPGGRYPNCDHESWSYVDQQDDRHKGAIANHHPTVKPISLMRWLVRLVTPPDGLVLDPFMGSGTTGIAATLEGFGFIGIEQDAEYLTIAERRIAHWAEEAADDSRQLALAAD